MVIGYLKKDGSAVSRYACNLAIDSKKIMSRIITKFLLSKFSTKTTKKGISLVELIIVVTIVGIISTPIANQILFSIRQNANSKKLLDATIMAQKYTETLQAVGDEIVNDIDIFPGDTPEQRAAKKDAIKTVGGIEFEDSSNHKYTISIARAGLDTATSTGSYSIKGFYDYYYFDLSQNNKLVIKKYKKVGDNSEELILTSSDITLSGFTIEADCKSATLPLNDGDDTNDDISIVFSDDNSIGIYENKQYRNVDKNATVMEDLGRLYGQITDTSNLETSSLDKAINYVRLYKSDAVAIPSSINVNVYNRRTAVIEAQRIVNLFYDFGLGDKIIIHTKYDTRNVIVHNIENTDAVRDTIVYKNTSKYTVQVKDDRGNTQVTRDVIYVE